MSPYQRGNHRHNYGKTMIFKLEEEDKELVMTLITVGAFGGARQGVEMGTYQSESDRNRAALLAGLYGQGYQSSIRSDSNNN